MNQDTYKWRTAPAHLRTRRQLRAAGLCPGRQAPVGLLYRQSRRRVLWAYLYDLERATPKRVATPAQLAALAAGNRARQIAAAERRGISITHCHDDSGPDWAQGTGIIAADVQNESRELSGIALTETNPGTSWAKGTESR